MRILLLNQTFHPDVVATAQYLTELAVGLRRAGHQVTVLTGKRLYDSPSHKLPPREEYQGVQIRRIEGTGFGKRSRWTRALDFGTFMLRCGWELLWSERQDVVVALTTPPLIAFLGACFCKLRGGRLVYWVMDLNPDEAVAAGWLRPDSLPARFLETCSRFSMRVASRIVVLDRFMRDRVAAKEIPPGKICVIPPWVQSGIAYDERGRGEFRSRHGLGDRFVVMYSGNHSPCHPLDNLIAAAREMRSEPEVVFCFVGGGSEQRKIREAAQSEGLENVVCLPYQPLSDLSGSLSAADLHVVVMGAAFVGMIHPCKIYNLISVGAPLLIVGPAASHLQELLESLGESPQQVRVEHGDVAATVAAIRRMRKASGRGSAAAYAGVCREFGREKLLADLVGTVEAAFRD